jgi:DNA-binding CsgD family transcriptional regulator/tetratricopeptide (TPR) repeat protein
MAGQIASVPLLLVGAYRDVELSRQHPLSKTLAALGRERRFVRIPVRGFERSEVGELVSSIGGSTSTDSITEEISERTEGNPFFIIEVARDRAQAVDSGTEAAEAASDFRIPEGVREAVGARLNRLSDRCNTALRAAAVIGREFDFRLLSAIAGDFTEDDLLNSVDEALDAHVIRVTSESRERYEFSHALVQQTLADELSASRRVRLHGQIVDAMEGLHRRWLADYVEEIAHHCIEAEAIIDVEKTARYTLLAGERAFAAYAFEDARAYFDHSLAALDGQPPDRALAAALFGLGRARMWLPDGLEVQDGFDNLARAFDLYLELGDREGAITVAVHPHFFYGRVSGSAELLSRALDLVSDDAPETGQLLELYGLALGSELEDAAGAKIALEKSLELARSTGNLDLEARVLGSLSWSRYHELDYRGSIEAGRAAIELARNRDRDLVNAWPHVGMAFSLLALGEPNAASHHVEIVTTFLERMGNREPAIPGWIMYQVARLRGDFTTMSEIGEFFDQAGDANAPAWMAAGAYACELAAPADLTSRIEAALEDGLSNLRRSQRSASVAYVALAAVITGGKRTADRAKEVASRLLSERDLMPMAELTARVTVSLAAVVARDRDGAAQQYRRLAPLRGTVAPHPALCMDRLLGLLAQAAGMQVEAGTHFEEALVFAGEAGFDLEVAWTCHDYAGLLLDADGVIDIERVASLVQDGLGLADRLGMHTLEGRLVALRARADSIPAPHPVYPDGLTRREVEVLTLLAGGRTNQQIADDLVIALSTVAKHVRNILIKTDCVNRAQAATYANLHGLVDSGAIGG